MEIEKCKYYSKHLETIFMLIDCLYHLDDCEDGGLLKNLVEEYNLDTDSIVACYKECLHATKKKKAN